ncbi:hypothetical protein [Salinivibrio socompensis]|uniref:hypothetical protein n=1 Tax=Salinivibrio socompensis TaxID=1510206 RepID=UPI000FE14915|nr:hypothetical protein [Salinivibrio socompensis]
MTKSTPSPLSAQTAQADHHNAPSAYRELALKSRREIHALKRLVSRLIATCTGKNTAADQKLTDFRDVLYSAQDVSALLPRLAVIERMVSHQDMTQKKHSHISSSSFTPVVKRYNVSLAYLLSSSEICESCWQNRQTVTQSVLSI